MAPDEKGFPLLEEEDDDDDDDGGGDFVFFTSATMTDARIFKRESTSDFDEPARGTKKTYFSIIRFLFSGIKMPNMKLIIY